MRRKMQIMTVLTLATSLVALSACSNSTGGTTKGTATASPGATDTKNGKTATPVKQKELKFWTHYKDTDPEQKWFQQMGQQYTDTVDKSVKITVESVPFDDYIGSKLISAFAAGEGPDNFLVAPPNMMKYYNAGILKDLTPYISPEAKKDFSPTAFDVTTVDSKIYGIPYESDLIGLYYDKDLFDKNGLKPPTTWDELKAAATKLKTDKKAGITFEVKASDFEVFMFSPFLWTTGADVFTADRKHSALDSEGVIKALKFWRDLMQSGLVNQKPSRGADDIGIIAEGETAMQVDGSWVMGNLESKYADKKIGVVPIPIPAGGKKATVAGGWKVVASAQSKNAEDAAKFAAWLFASSDPARSVAWDSQVKFAFPVRQSVLAQAKPVFDKGLRKDFTDNILGTEKAEMRITPEVSKILIDMIQKAMYKTDMSVEDIVKEANTKLEAFLKDFKGTM
ncbi:hypothetical protein A8709_32720 [Paenibacillus pectinilyticus]|uniref:Sugar ABC transporter substrate-binding protein n=1 Tax=Paenibacillus pectinilyticus TaxID=512399 RepID=A0A1C0ZWU3_9BACL|nr:sugar ABC transporter substrate-binding protein [Paenibacillus pectinilyticus]OCT12581.1 hypothetical protein A8709_32720 [Paenibacillus pectinilyticus]